MKRTLLIPIVSFLLIANITEAQTTTKKFYISGGINFSNRKSVNFPNSTLPANTRNSFGFSPKFGFLLNRNMIAGIGISFQQSKTHTFSRSNLPIQYISWNNYQILERKLAPSVFFTYQRELGERFILGINNSVLLGMEGKRIEDLTQSGTSTSESKLSYGTIFLEALFSPEIQFMLTENLGIQTTFSLFRAMLKEESNLLTPIRTTEFEFNLNPENWVFGLVLYLD